VGSLSADAESGEYNLAVVVDIGLAARGCGNSGYFIQLTTATTEVTLRFHDYR
jgi:hypothetical protein